MVVKAARALGQRAALPYCWALKAAGPMHYCLGAEELLEPEQMDVGVAARLADQ